MMNLRNRLREVKMGEKNRKKLPTGSGKEVRVPQKKKEVCNVNHMHRFTAYLIDWFVGALCMNLPIMLLWLMQTKDMDNASKLSLGLIADKLGMNMAGIAVGLGFLASVFYFVIVPWKILPGQTVGKRIMHFKVVKTNGEKAGLGTLLVREVIGIFVLEGVVFHVSGLLKEALDLFTGLNFSGYLMWEGIIVTVVSGLLCMCVKNHRMIHDYIAGTKVEMC